MKTRLPLRIVLLGLFAPACMPWGSGSVKARGGVSYTERGHWTASMNGQPAPAPYVQEERWHLHPGAPGLCWKQLYLRDDFGETRLLRPEDEEEGPGPPRGR